MSTPSGTPAAEIAVDESLVRTLLEQQHPDLARASLVLIDSGWDNVTYRLGDHLAVRLPRREIAAKLIENEQRWLPEIAGALPLPTPVPVRTGVAQNGYPWPWSVVPWLDGVTADLEEPASDQAVALSEFLEALHQEAPANAPVNDVRGVPLADRAETVEERLRRLRKATDRVTPAIESAWQAGLDAPPAAQDRWLHGDFHPRNVLVDGGRLAGVIDWGDITSGDVATDLAGIWMLFSGSSARDAALARYAPNAATTARAIGWAVLFGVVMLDSGLVDNPPHAAIGAKTLERVGEDVERLG